MPEIASRPTVGDGRVPTPEVPTARRLRTGYLGRIEYSDGVARQEAVREAVLRGDGEEHLLLLEHDPVFTLGRNADRGNLLATEEWLERNGIRVHQTDRGGQITYHGPGQLVGYPIVDLDPDRRDIRRYIRDLQETLLRTLADYGVQGEPGLPDRPAGVWIGPLKIASVGVHLRRWVTTHGFALNVTTDLGHFAGIVPCGLDTVQMTSIERLTASEPELADIAACCARHFADIFGRRLEPLDQSASFALPGVLP